MKHFQYLRYLLKHKWYVAVECVKHGLYFHAFAHDLSKFRPSEWFPYVEYFYGALGKGEAVQLSFDLAWLKHQHRNRHHYQHWVLLEDEGQTKALLIPDKAIVQMACDWIGASKAIRGKNATAVEWYEKVRKNMESFMDNLSRKKFEQLICFTPSL